MVENIGNISGFVNESLYTEKTTQELGLDNFLKMFLAQLEHQNPLDPMEGSEFSAQLAQFSSLEQLFDVNDNLESLLAAQDQNSRFQALDFIGKEVVAEGDRLSLKQGETAKGSFTLNGTANCTVAIFDSNGHPLREISMGTLGPGQHPFEWDGHDGSGAVREPGIYGFEITAVTEDGQIIPVETLITGRVTRVNLEGGSTLLYVGEIPLTISQIMDIKEPEPAGDVTT
jgi:flagellar basal-body rod modification protein FlgD